MTGIFLNILSLSMYMNILFLKQYLLIINKIKSCILDKVCAEIKFSGLYPLNNTAFFISQNIFLLILLQNKKKTIIFCLFPKISL